MNLMYSTTLGFLGIWPYKNNINQEKKCALSHSYQIQITESNLVVACPLCTQWSHRGRSDEPYTPGAHVFARETGHVNKEIVQDSMIQVPNDGVSDRRHFRDSKTRMTTKDWRGWERLHALSRSQNLKEQTQTEGRERKSFPNSSQIF